jgi:hypothetical protein
MYKLINKKVERVGIRGKYQKWKFNDSKLKNEYKGIRDKKVI